MNFKHRLALDFLLLYSPYITDADCIWRRSNKYMPAMPTN